MSVTRANTLTATWASMTAAAAFPAAFSAAAIYPLLALLASVATGRAAFELSAVAPTPLDLPLRGALGLWTREGTPLTLDWAARADPRLTGDPLIDRPLLDAWAAAQTGAPVPPFHLPGADEDTLILAAALAVTADWTTPFTDGVLRPFSGPWAGRRLASLHRRTADLTPLRVLSTPAAPITLLTITGTDEVDVILCTAAGQASPQTVLAAAVSSFPSATPARKGPGVVSALVDASDPTPELVVKVPRFAASLAHDLLAPAAADASGLRTPSTVLGSPSLPDAFGLRAASTPSAFPGISSAPLRVSAAAVSVAAAFTAPGFRAAPVTQTPIVPLAYDPPPPATARRLQVTVRFDEPFGYFAVHRPTGLVLMAGWIDEPEPAH
ncbi:hypothetical protein ACQP00_43690 [Dactylosporangium sp. CS-047395]|uniref:hypothetical protein n=1 Tax=Dactylosporangium sp. CS-047395 TaxID=3239936 RepID=UPI003D94D3F7